MPLWFDGGMTQVHRLSRRSFLSDLGKGTVGVAILGLGACTSSESDGGAATTTTAAATSTSGASATSSTPTTEGDSGPLPLEWERVALGNVSAYVLARGTEIAIVDTGGGGSGPEILKAIGTLGGTWDSVNHVILTHSHGDHVGSLPEIFRQARNAKGYAGTADLDRITVPFDLTGVNGGEEIFGLQIIGTPGHTPGHISVYDSEAELFVAGDALTAPDGVAQGPSERFTPDMETANMSVKDIAALDFETLLVGHGEPILTGGGAAVKALAEAL